MRNSRERVITSHVGSMSRPDDLVEANRKREAHEGMDEATFQKVLRDAGCDLMQGYRPGAPIDPEAQK